MNKNLIVVNSFSNKESEKLYKDEWPDEPNVRKAYSEDCNQCGGCSFFAPFNSDWGLCCYKKSRHFLETVFEHFTCPSFVIGNWGSHSFSDRIFLDAKC